jgi:hypothetical protein
MEIDTVHLLGFSQYPGKKKNGYKYNFIHGLFLLQKRRKHLPKGTQQLNLNIFLLLLRSH